MISYTSSLINRMGEYPKKSKHNQVGNLIFFRQDETCVPGFLFVFRDSRHLGCLIICCIFRVNITRVFIPSTGTKSYKPKQNGFWKKCAAKSLLFSCTQLSR